MKVAGVLVLANVTIKGANFGGLERRKNVVPIRSTFKVCTDAATVLFIVVWLGSGPGSLLQSFLLRKLFYEFQTGGNKTNRKQQNTMRTTRNLNHMCSIFSVSLPKPLTVCLYH